MVSRAKNTPVQDEPLEKELDQQLEKESGKLEEMAEKAQQNQQMAMMQQMQQSMAQLMKKLDNLEKENEELKKNSVGTSSPFGGKDDYERVKDACEKAAAEGLDPWTVKISVRAPYKGKKEDPNYWLSVNAKTIGIPANDRYYELALPFAQCLEDMIRAEKRASEFIDGIEEFDPVTHKKENI